MYTFEDLIAGWETHWGSGHKLSYGTVRELESRRIVASCSHRHSRSELAHKCANRLRNRLLEKILPVA